MTGTTVPARSTPNGGRREMLGEGVVAGVLGATALAGWFLVVDGIQRVPLLTVSILGSILVSGDPDLPAPHSELAAAGVYTFVLYLLFELWEWRRHWPTGLRGVLPFCWAPAASWLRSRLSHAAVAWIWRLEIRARLRRSAEAPIR